MLRTIAHLVVEQPELACRVLLVHKVAHLGEVGAAARLVELPQQLAELMGRLAQRIAALAVDLNVAAVEFAGQILEAADQDVGVCVLLRIDTQILAELALRPESKSAIAAVRTVTTQMTCLIILVRA